MIFSQLICIFQFHMVRLKARAGGVIPENIVISIPYGTIKGKSIDETDASNPISIPYGTIKGGSGWSSSRPTIISIPYGTIKGMLNTLIDDVIPLFQFHMVRLKECRSIEFSLLIPYFNSIWYD